ncbi:MAG: ribonuclease R [Parvularculaceae bacterium]
MAPKRPAAALPTKRAILDWLKTTDGDAARRDIARAFDVKGPARADLRALLKEMEADGLIGRSRPKRVAVAGELPPVLPVDVTAIDDDGGLVCAPTTWREKGAPPRIRVSPREQANQKPAPGVDDRLLVRTRRSGDGYEAQIIKPIGKAAHRALAVFRAKRFGGLAEPLDRRARTKFTIERQDARGAKDGDLVWIEAAPRRGSSSTYGRVRDIVGHVDDEAAHSLIALANHGVRLEMPAAAVAEADRASAPGTDDRENLRDRPLVTIDPADANDHDDAVWAAPDGDDSNPGGFVVVVAIADVSWFVRPGSALDEEALKRGNSVYMPDRVVPMLPERLSNDLCSLREGEDRPCLAVEMVLDAGGRKRRHRFMRAVMRSAAKLSYEDAQGVIDGGGGGDAVAKTVRTLKAAFDARWSERAKRAPLDLDLPERRIVLGADGRVDRVERRERFDAHRLIEEFMILANIAAAETLERRKRTQIYRVHDAPDPERLDAARDYLASLGYSLVKGGSVRPANFNQILKTAEARGQKEMVSEAILRAQQQAVYATENVGHFGLNLPRYSHFTSPIRRYADLTVHRALVAACGLGPGGQTDAEAAALPRIADEISDLERRAMAAEREAKDRYLAAHLEARVGEEFDARIRGVTRFGVFVALDETGADGFVPMRSLGAERFRFEERLNAVVGEASGEAYQLGQSVRVRLVEAAPLVGALRFDMLSDPIPLDASACADAPAASRARRRAKPKKPGGESAKRGKAAKTTSSKSTARPKKTKGKTRRARRSNAKPTAD